MADSAHTTDLSRRTMFGRIPVAALATTAIFSALTVPADAADHPDAELLAMGPGLSTLDAEYHAAIDAYGEAETAFFQERPQKPVFDIELHTALKGEAQRAHQQNWPVRLKEYEAECERIKQKHNADALERIKDDIENRVVDRFEELSLLRATTMDGLKLKARWAKESPSVAQSIIGDILDI